ncbi:MFS transporter [Brachybacterium sp. EF45031]|uniref:MFS transporter n=1 Tax=Brachybacterium sillae TaxID=2810536 RepID=UPI00217CC80D|nr:MFS transporter [Brachybacterium sillae]MCS6712500.1 MFS transporter [Brachybacterium sillae]
MPPGTRGATRAITAVGAFSCLVVALQQTLVVPAVPRFGVLLGAGPTAIGWLVTATLLTGAIATPVIGRLSDLVGKRRMAVLSIAAIVLIALTFPPSVPDDRGGFDLTGAILMTIALSALLLAVSRGNTWGWGSLATIGCLAVGLVVGVAWVVFDLRVESPLVDIRTSASRPLLMTNLASIVMGVLMFTNLLLTTLTLQNPVVDGGFGWSAGAAGLAMLPNAAAMFGVAALSSSLAHRMGPRSVLAIGAVVIGMGYLLRLLVTPNAVAAIIWTTVIGIGAGIGYAALPMLVARYAPVREMGSANGVNALMRAIGSAISSSMVTAITTALAVRAAGASHPSAAALALIAGLGVILAGVSLVLALAARGDAATERAIMAQNAA